MRGIQIVSTGRALPKNHVSNDDLSRIVDTNDEWIAARTGIRYRYKCEEESCVSLAVSAAREAIERAGAGLDEIGAIIVATSTPDRIFPSVACMIQKEIGIDENVMSFDLSAACTGFLYGLGVAYGLLQTMPKKYVLVVGSEQLSRIVDYTDRSSCILFGDGAGAAIVKGSEEHKFYQKSWTRGNIEALNCPGPGISVGSQHLEMRGNDVYKFAVNALAQAVDEVMNEVGITMDDVDYCICHQANARIIGHVQKKFPGQEDKFYMNLDNYGNTSAASIPIVLDEMFEKGLLQKGMKILCVGFGAGLTWSGAYLEL